MKLIFTFISIFILGIAVYGNVLNGDFIWDDESFVVNNEYIKSFRYVPRYFTEHEALAEGGISLDSYRPLVPLSFAIDHKIWGLNPFGYHLTNILLHICNAFLVFWMIRSIFRKYLPAFFSALIFLVHPVQTEVVSWISGRGNLLFLFFYVLSLILYVRFKNIRKPGLYFASVSSFAISLLCREMAVSLPVILILYAVLFGGRSRKTGLIFLESAPYFLLVGIFVLVRFYVIGSIAQGEWWTGAIFTTFLTMLTGFLYYLKVLIWPFGLCADHLMFPVVKTFSDMGVIISLLLISGLAGAALLYLRNRPLVISFGILWFFITLGPVLNIIPMKILVADRFLYLPIIGYCIVLPSLVYLFIRTKRTRYTVFVFLILFYSVVTIIRNKVWADELSFYSDIAARYDDNCRAGVNLSLAHFRRGNIDSAIKESVKVINNDAHNYKACMQLSDYYLRKNEFGKAQDILSVLLEECPDTDVLLRQAKIFLAEGYIDKALNVYQNLIPENGSFVYAEAGIIQIYLIRGENGKAVKEIEDMLRNKKGDDISRALSSSLYLMLGDTYLMSGENEKAEKIWNSVISNYQGQGMPVLIAKLMTNTVSEQVYLKNIEHWSPDLRRVALYFMGSKKASLESPGEAVEYFERSVNVEYSSAVFIKLLAERRIRTLQELMLTREKTKTGP